MDATMSGFSKRLATTLQPAASTPASSGLVDDLVDIANRTDSYSIGHSTRVSDYATALARLCDIEGADLDMVRQAGLLHDVGKIAIPEQVLRKSTPLTDEELHLLHLHPIFGASIASRLQGLDKRVVKAILHHHEHWDGSGYPQGLAGVDIPQESRILLVADAFDAMTSYRPYAEVKSADQAMQELRRCSGTQFDPRLVEAMHQAQRYGMLEKRAALFPRHRR